MPWTKMSTVPNPLLDINGDPYSGAVLKAYLVGTTTSTSIAIAAAGTSPQTTITYNSGGKLEVSGNEIIPYIDREAKWAIFANSTDATANTPAYMGFFDNVPQSVAANGISSIGKDFATLALAVASADIEDGDVLNVAERTSGNGGGAFWDVVLSSTVTENTYNIVQGTGVGTLSLVLRVGKEAVVDQFGAFGGADDTDAIQAAIDLIESKSGGDVVLVADHQLSVTKGTNDKYGLKIDSSNVRLIGRKGASLRRSSSDISTAALSFPLLLVGAPDDNSTQILDIEITGIKFIGEDTQHSTSGSGLMDGRQAIWLKNVRGCLITENRFTNIDSGAIFTQRPGQVDEENTAFYNTTKCHDITITKNRFDAVAHSTAGRAVMHVIETRADNVIITDNIFFWCDVCVSSTTTYDNFSDKETNTYTDSNVGTVQRTGKGLVINNNSIYNSSEHCFYLNGMNVVCSNNSIAVDNTTVCNVNQIQIRGRGVTVKGNTLTGVFRGAVINTGAINVVFSGNNIQASGDHAGGIIGVNTAGLTAFIDGRSDFFGSYKQMTNIVIADNVIDMVEASQTDGVGLRLNTDSSDANFPDGQMQNIIIKGNTFNRARKGILTLANMARNVKIQDNIFNGKAFIEAAFNGSTVMNSEYVLGVDDSLATPLQNVTFDNNTIYGYEHILFDDGGAGSAGTIVAPWGIRGNQMSYIQHWDTAAFIAPTQANMMHNNQGTFFLDRTGWFAFWSINNSLGDGTSNTDKKSMLQLVSSTDVRLYHDDSNAYVQLYTAP